MQKNKFGLVGIALLGALSCFSGAGCGTNGNGMNLERVEKFEQEIILPDGRKKVVKDVIKEDIFGERRRITCLGNKEYQAYGKYDVLNVILEDGKVIYRRQTLDMPLDFGYFAFPYFGAAFAALAPINGVIARFAEIKPYSGKNGVGLIEQKHLETIRRVDRMKNIEKINQNIKNGKR